MAIKIRANDTPATRVPIFIFLSLRVRTESTVLKLSLKKAMSRQICWDI
jgi:hypothetical protein